METKQLRKLLNAAWDECYYRSYTFGHKRYPMSEYWVRRRYRDVSKIIEEMEKAERRE